MAFFTAQHPPSIMKMELFTQVNEVYRRRASMSEERLMIYRFFVSMDDTVALCSEKDAETAAVGSSRGVLNLRDVLT